MDYGRLKPSEPGSSFRSDPLNDASSSQTTLPQNRRKRLILFISIFSLTLIIAAAVSATILVCFRTRASDHRGSRYKPSQAISKACSRTRYPDLCVHSLVDFPGSQTANEPDLVHISFNMTLLHFSRALYSASGFSAVQMAPRVKSAYDDCLELLDDSIDALSRSLNAILPASQQSTVSTQDVLTWLSAALTNQDTCMEGFEDVSGTVKDQMTERLHDLSELVSNCLAIFSWSAMEELSGVPIQNKRRLLEADISDQNPEISGAFPKWLGRRDRELLSSPVSTLQADIVVSQDGSDGAYKTISEAIKKAPENWNRRTIIYIRAGRYQEADLKVGRKKTNLMFVGDGKGKTIIAGDKSVYDDLTTFHTAVFAGNGAGIILRDMTFENSAGPNKHQAVALRVGADHGVVYRCSIVGYQDTLYVHSNRQFFRECDIYGTVDFIFGNAAVVFQNCNIFARKPMANQKNTITAQNRKDPNQNTGISIHACRIVATSDLMASKGSFPTYLGRPWKLYSRVVYMLSYIGDHVDPKGWLPWNGGFALDTLYYGEYQNNGPGAAIGQRVNWPGYRVITSTVEASKFTVSQFIYGSSWLPSTGVAFLGGL